MNEVKTDKEAVFCTKLCSSKNKPIDNSTIKSPNSQSNEEFISSFGNENQNNQTLLTAAEIKSPVGKAIRKSIEQDIELQSLSKTDTNCLPEMSTEPINLKANSAYEITKVPKMSTQPINLKANSAYEITTVPVANLIRKSLNHAELAKSENNIFVDTGQTEDNETIAQLKCFVAATRSK